MTIPFVATPSWERGPAPAAPAASPAPTAAPAPSAPGADGTTSFTPPRADAAAGTASSVPRADAAVDLAVLGPLAPFAASGPVTDLFVNGASGLWVDRGSGPEREPSWAADEAEVRALAVRLIARGGRHIDEATPAVDVRLGRGIRVHAVLPPVSTVGTLLSVRVPRASRSPRSRGPAWSISNRRRCSARRSRRARTCS